MLSKIAQNITPSATCELEGVVADMKAAGVDIIGMNAGEPDFETPENIRDACKWALDEGKTRYVNVPGIADLRKAICEKLKKDNGVDYTPAQICVSTGAKQALNNAVMATVNAGDEVIIPMPGWVSYVEIVKLVGGIPVCVETMPDFQLDLDAIEKAITPKTAAIMINTPNNPTGAVYTRESLEKLADLAVKHDFYIISDEVYEKLIYNGKKHACVASFSEDAYNHTIIINGMSKAFAMTGWRCGYTAAPADIAAGISAIQGHTTSNSTTFVQWAAIEALKHNDNTVKEMVGEYARRKDYTYGRLTAMKGIVCANVDGAFYLLPDVSYYFDKKADGRELKDSFGFCNYILEKAHVAIVPGGAFNAPRCVRIAYTNSMEKIAEGLDRIEKALSELED